MPPQHGYFYAAMKTWLVPFHTMVYQNVRRLLHTSWYHAIRIYNICKFIHLSYVHQLKTFKQILCTKPVELYHKYIMVHSLTLLMRQLVVNVPTGSTIGNKCHLYVSPWAHNRKQQVKLINIMPGGNCMIP